MQDLFPIPSCFSSGEKLADDPIPTTASATRSGQSIVISLYQTKIAGYCRLITVTWCKNLLAHGLSVSIEGSEGESEDRSASSSGGSAGPSPGDGVNSGGQQYTCKVEMRPWYFWRKHGSKRFSVEGKDVDVFWDLRNAKFSDEAEPHSDYYVAVVSDEEVVLMLGDLKKDAYRRTGARPSIIDAILVSKKEHVFGKKRFSTRAKFHEKGKCHEITVECNSNNNSSGGGGADSDMAIKVDGHVAIQVRHLQWKFRGNDSISINKRRVEVCWDVHDWLFSPGLRHALFIFKPETTSMTTSTAATSLCSWSGHEEIGNGVHGAGGNGDESSGFCLFLYAWKLE